MAMTAAFPAASEAVGPALHIPDGFLSLPVAAAGYVASAVAIAVAVHMTNRRLGERAVPVMGVMGAFIFAAQMMNFPVAGGTSGHMLGGALGAICLGPWAAILVMTSVVALQALLFQDGGLGALGANVFTMGVVTALAGAALYAVLRPLAEHSSSLRVVASFAVAWTTVMLAAALTSVELALSGTSPLAVVLPAMLGVHALIGVGEGLITAGALSFLLATRPDLVGVATQGARP
ncbi:MAG: cobalamin biosynthesis protein CbiM [Chloroflexi bacterium]|nr:cobalamin biosynthesis protein CbiM [Chloroflexota bacterium]